MQTEFKPSVSSQSSFPLQRLCEGKRNMKPIRHTHVWDGERPASSIYDVWSFLSTTLRELRNDLNRLDMQFYGNSERIEYIDKLNVSLKVLSKENVTNRPLYCTKDLIDRVHSIQRIETPTVKEAKGKVSEFVAAVKQILPEMKSLKVKLCLSVLQHLEDYCYDYQKLGTTDDSFYRELRVRILQMKELLAKFDSILLGIQGGVAYSSCFCDDRFSEEIAITYDCESFPILRACSDMIQKLFVACDIAQDWLRSDKVYMDELETQADQTKIKIKEKEDDYELHKLEYNKIFSTLKQNQNQLEHLEVCDNGVEEIKTTLSRLEVYKCRLEMECAAIRKMLQNCRDNLRLRELRSTACPPSCAGDDQDEVDGCNPDRLGLASSKYRDRASQNTDVYTTKLHDVTQKLHQVIASIKRQNNRLKQIESANKDIERYTRKLKTVAKKKTQCYTDIQSLNDHLRQLETTLKRRKYPKPQQRSRTSSQTETRESYSPSPDTNSRLTDRRISNLSADLRRAFRLVKNNIGYGWKDLARTLPNNPHKGITEINNDIKAIEHDNAGHLKEQAYQYLMRWYSHNGCKASLGDLVEALREIEENRLADKIQGFLPDDGDNSVQISPRSSDSGIE